MARHPTPSTPQPANLTVRQMEIGIARLEKRIAEVEELDPMAAAGNPSAATDGLQASVADAIARTFGPNTVEHDRYRDAAVFHWPIYMNRSTSPSEVAEGLQRSRTRSLNLLRQAVSSLRERIEEAGAATGSTATQARAFDESNRRIFVVHGREEGPREAVARFLEQLGFQPIILHEQANRGRTVIEKVEGHSEVSFAVVLLTPDDEGNLRGEARQPRARQNVLLELGYFVGKLGRDRVCALQQGDMEIPSDWAGIIDERFDTRGAWKQVLARELQAAGFDIDWNHVMRPHD
jgi:predicted nucleotide-binding protein